MGDDEAAIRQFLEEMMGMETDVAYDLNILLFKRFHNSRQTISDSDKACFQNPVKPK